MTCVRSTVPAHGSLFVHVHFQLSDKLKLSQQQLNPFFQSAL